MENISNKISLPKSYWFNRLLNPTKKDLILTLVIWTLLPAPDLGQIVSRGGNIQWLPGIAPANFFYGILSILHPISRLIIWGGTSMGWFPGYPYYRYGHYQHPVPISCLHYFSSFNGEEALERFKLWRKLSSLARYINF